MTRLIIPGRCADLGGMYRYKFIAFWNFFVFTELLTILMVRSKKSTDLEGSFISHDNFPKLFKSHLNSSQRSPLSPVQIPNKSSIKSHKNGMFGYFCKRRSRL